MNRLGHVPSGKNSLSFSFNFKCSFILLSNSPNGEVIVTGDDSGHICIWGQSKTIIQNIKFHEETLTALAFSHDSAIMLSACSQGNIRLYNVEDGFESKF